MTSVGSTQYGGPRDLRVLVAIAAIAAAVLTALTWTILAAGAKPLGIDETVHRWMVSGEWDPLSTAARGITHLGDSPAIWVITGVVAVALLAFRRWWAGFILALGMGLDIGLVRAGKTMVQRARPADLISTGHGTSFPSGHSAYAVAWAVMGIIAVRSIPALRGRTWPIWLGVAIAVLIPMSRVYLRPHWLTDTIGGAATGSLAFALMAIVVVTATSSRTAP